jgi:cyclic beta-1,2-glucan synthetase
LDLPRFDARKNRPPHAPWNHEPIRAELFSVERLEQHAESLAAAQPVTPRPWRGRPLAARLHDNGRVLLQAYRSIAQATREDHPITPAAEWLIDNFHVVDDQIREIRDDLPPGFYRQLPKLAEGPLQGYPRVFGLAWAFVAHTDSRYDSELLCRFVHAYQRVQPLTIGELWAVAITLRIVLVENLRRLAEGMVSRRAARSEADILADRLLGVGGEEAQPVGTVLAGLDRASVSAAFAVQLVQRLRDQDPKVTPALLWLDERLSLQRTTADEIVREEHQRQGATNATIRNIITSMRLISNVDWTELFERVSLVDATLRAGSRFTDMDFPTRDLYRRAIEELSRGSRRSELDVAARALLAAQVARDEPPHDGDAAAERERDPGYYLIGNGRRRFEKELGFRVPMRGWLVRINDDVGISGYLATIAVVMAIVTALGLFASAKSANASALFVLALFALIPASDVAVALVNRVAANRVRATILPGLALRSGIPSQLRTMIVVPTLLTTHSALEEQIERLEVHHLASPDGDIRYAMLSDWTDCAEEHAPDDNELLDAAAAATARLNERYGPAPEGDRFLLLHRRRVWNADERWWMGWERKRGKLHELNRLLRGARDTTFMAIGGRPPMVPSGVRYVITLDGDTRLPRGAARRLVGKMAHPLNRPTFDAGARRVVAGHAVLQPRVAPSLPTGREGSLFQRVYSSPGGIDPYAFAVSDLYQDLFGEGSYSGKGIYDVDVFEASLEGKIPEGTVLSHDLLEGTFARAALCSDVEVVEEFPARYDVVAARQHRWARGDWQLLPWILGLARAATGDRRRTTVPLIGRWKMIDNLRRSASMPAAVAALLAGWTLPFVSAGAWSAFVLAAIATPALLPLLAGIPPRRNGISKRSHLIAVVSDLRLALWQIALQATLLAHQAWLMADAILRTLFRLLISRRNLLEWITAAQSMIGPRLSLGGLYYRMAGAVVIAAAAAALVAWVRPGCWPVAAPFVALWLASPAVARWASLPPPMAAHKPVSATDERALRLIARRTWRFFETFITAEDHMLPPDNFQEAPKPVLAHRTSPTNLGLYLLSIIAARDFGWLGTLDAVERLEATLATMNGLERFHGHFYNWYETRDLRPLDPKYVSSVDSGNLAGHLIVVSSACREFGRSAANVNWKAGVEDALALARQSLSALSDDRQAATHRRLADALDRLAASLDRPAATAVSVAGDLAALARLAKDAADIARVLAREQNDDASAEVLAWTESLDTSIHSHLRDFVRADALVAGVEPSDRASRSLDRRLAELCRITETMFKEMGFGFLLDPARQLLSIGYQVMEGRLDPSCYDLLASEARLASFVAIAKGDVPARHWFRLGRAVTPVDLGSALISWSGSMFEYLMPSLVMRAPGGSLLGQTARLVVRRQIRFGAELGVPWGVSESAYNVRDLEFTYQYSTFGIPGLGLKRGLSENAVIAPYATALAAMIDPAAAVQNFAALAAAGGRGRYGWYEALDYTPKRLAAGEQVSVVRAYMAHHQGMTIVAIANALLDGAMRRRFHGEPIVQATELLLQERPPRDVAVARPRVDEVRSAADIRQPIPPVLRRFQSPHDLVPRTHLLSNGNYGVMITNAGSGYSRWRDLAITRWREDVTCDSWGFYIFLKDASSEEAWSAGYQPSGVAPDSYEATFSEDQAEIVRHDGTLTTTLAVAVSPEDDAEVRRVSISNLGTAARNIDVTSYAELVLAPQATDVAHPAFSKLFVQTEFVAEVGTLLATRRRRSPDEPEVWAAHLAVVEGEAVGDLEFETDRARFLGRGRRTATAVGATDGRPLSNTAGTVLDPIFSLRRRVKVPPGSTVRVAFWTLIASSRANVLDLADKHLDPAAFERAVTLAWTQAQVQLQHLGISSDEAHLFQRLANRVLYADPSLRPSSEMLKQNMLGPSVLWPHGISGDLPIVLVRVDETEHLGIVRQLLRAHEYWRMKQLAVDLVILNERPPSYDQDLHGAMQTLARPHQSRPPVAGKGLRGTVFIVRADLATVEARTALQTVARAVLVGRRGSLAEQVKRLRKPKPAGPPPRRRSSAGRLQKPALRSLGLEFFNGLGGFAEDGREYVTILGEGRRTPAPWVNVIANPTFGFQVAVDGGGYTWSINSRENQLTPWSNDPISDPPGEVIYLRDEETGDLWGPAALPIRTDASPYVVRHGQGYSRFEHAEYGMALELLQYVPIDDPIKISRLKIRNESERRRRLSLTAYVEWVLGASRGSAAPFVVTEIDVATGAMLARNPWRAELGGRFAFLDLGGRQQTWTADRTEFIGRNGSLDCPGALAGAGPLSNRTGAGLDPCGALQTYIELEPKAATEIVVFLGDAASRGEALALVARYRTADLDAVLSEVKQHWERVLGAVQVKTPDRSLDILMNRWLLYQTLACRVWARAAFYQASGAYGFRDQLQDGMALTAAMPSATRRHLLRAAARQFAEGDVQHWWLPQSGQGVRTRVSDDRVWLAYAVANYVEVTGDNRVLDELVPYLDGPALRPGEHDAYFQPLVSDKRASLFEHCAWALDQSLAVGDHGLPLIGTGDWNDGMNRVGEQGKGESVWLGWFLHAALSALAPLAEVRGERERAAIWRRHAVALREAIERNGWDGGWYRRGYFDDGTPLGSGTNTECRIDSIAQSWGVISGAADPVRAASAMAAVAERLVRHEDGLVLLFTPPFDQTSPDPGYIKGYPPGIRENGGQYTHAALWSVVAFALLGNGDKAVELFSLLNPIKRSNTREAAERYKVEPYVVAADVYAEPPHGGRGGWTWYTGSAGWMYRAGLEWILGCRMQGGMLLLDPCVPTTWPGFEIALRHGTARYEISVDNPDGLSRGVSHAEIDGAPLPAGPIRLQLMDDGLTHRLQVRIGPPAPGSPPGAPNREKKAGSAG